MDGEDGSKGVKGMNGEDGEDGRDGNDGVLKETKGETELTVLKAIKV